MNKIHKSQYNEALGTWVAVPEFAKSRGKRANSVSGGISMDTALPKFAFSALTVAVLQVISPTVWAVSPSAPSSILTNFEPAKCTAYSADGNITYDPHLATSIICGPQGNGKYASTINDSGVLVGNYNYARMSTVVGNNNYVNAKDGIAIGHDSIISSDIETAAANGDEVPELKGGNSISVGSHNRINKANTLALGNHITKTKENSVFLGNDTAYIPERSEPTDSIGAKKAKDENDTSYAGMTKLDSAADAGGSKVVGVVSVGNENATRRIQGVAPGLVAKDSTDAINGGQLAAAYEKIDGNTTKIDGNTTKIDGNTKNIAGNTKNIAGNTKNIAGNTTKIDGNTKNITKNAEAIKSGRVFAGDVGDEKVTVALGKTLKLTGGAKDHLSNSGNIGVVVNNKDQSLEIRLNKNLSGLDSIALGSDADKPNTKLSNNGIIIHPASGDKISLTDNGLNNGNNRITNVDDGKEDTDAVNVRQLKNSGFTISDGASGSYYVKPNDTITFKGGEKTSVQVNGSTVTIGLDDETSDKLSGEIVKTLVGNFDSSATPDKDGKTHLVGGYTGLSGKPSTTEIEEKLSSENLAVIQGDDGNSLAVVMAKDPTFDSITVGGSAKPITINKESGRIEGLTNITLDNLDDGTEGTAATEAQLGLLKGKVDGNTTHITNNTNNITKNAEAIKSGRVFAGDDGKKVNAALGETLNLKGDASASALSDKANIGVIADEDAKGLKIRLNKDLSGLDSIALGSDADKPNTKLTNNGITIHPVSGADISLTDNGLDNGNNKITHVAKGTDDSDAVNFGQLKEVENKLFEGFSISDGTHKHDVKSKDIITFKGGEKTSVQVDGSTVTIGLDNDTRDKLSGEIVKTLVGNFDSSATPDKGGKTHLVGGYTGLSGKPSTTEIEEKLSSENLAVIQGDDGNSLAVVMAKDPTFRKLSATDSITVGGSDSGSAKPIITINQEPGRIEGLTNTSLDNLDNGSKGTAATEAQLGLLNKKVEGNTTNITNNTKNITKNTDVISSGRLFAGDDDKEVKVGLGETLNLKGDASASALSDEANIGVIADKDAKGLKIRLNKDLSGLDSIALGSDADKPNTKLSNNGITIHPASGDDISLTDNGLDNGNKKIVHVAKGLVDDSSTDAINGSQLHDIVTSLGGGAGFSKGTYTPPKYVITTTPAKPEDVAALVGDDHPADNVDDALKKLNAYVNQGFLIRDASNNNYQVIPGRTVTFNGTTETVVTVGKDKDGNGTVTVGLAKDAVDKINGSVQKLAGNVGTASPDKAGITHIEGAYQPKSGLLSGDMDKDGLSAKNIAVVGDDKNTLKIAMSESPDFHKITATGAKENPDLGKANVITVDGDTGHIDGLTNVTLDSLPTSADIASGKIKTSKAATEAQLRRVIDQATKNGVVINKGRTFKGDDDKAVTVGLGETLNITGGAKPDELSQANNLGVVQDASNGLKVKLNKNISGLDSVALGTDAAKPTTKLDGNGITITPKDSKKAPVSLTDAGLNNGMNKITNVADGVDDNDAVNVSQLKHMKTEVTEIHNKIYNGWNLSVVDADGSDKYGMVESDGRVAFDSRPTDTVIARSVASKPHKNIHIGIDRSTGKQTVFFDLDKDIKVESVTTGGSMVNNDGLSTGNGEGPAVRSDGIDMKRHKIRSLSPGEISATSEDGVNGSQLYAVADAINKSIGGDTKVTYEGDKPTFIFNNIGGTGKSTIDEAIKSIKAKNDPTTVKSIDKSIVVNNVNEGKDAAPSYEVSLAPVVDVDKSLTVANKVTINNNGINAGNTKITNVADGRIAPDSQDAVNGRQLYKVAQNINDMDTRARSGIASAMAAAGLPQAYLPGKSMVSAAASHYRGENAIAVGVSSISDNGKWLVKADANANRKDFGVSLGVGYQW